jgi:crossover junction endodeoxyribonuclease RuvC
MKIFSIDPGYERVGMAILEKNKGEQKETLVFSQCFKTSAKLSLPERLVLIGQEMETVIKKYKPEIFAIEDLFFSSNKTTAMGVSAARGVMMYIAGAHNIPVEEYNPLQIKNAVTGYGKATKAQVFQMVRQLVDIPENVTQDDEIDAIAVGITAFAHHRF